MQTAPTYAPSPLRSPVDRVEAVMDDSSAPNMAGIGARSASKHAMSTVSAANQDRGWNTLTSSTSMPAHQLASTSTHSLSDYDPHYQIQRYQQAPQQQSQHDMLPQRQYHPYSDQQHTRFHESTSLPSSSLRHNDQPVNNASSNRPISEAELMAMVVEKRLQASSGLATQPSSMSRQTSMDSTHRPSSSKDVSSSSGDTTNSIDTLDLCHKRIEIIPEGLADIIKHDVVRLALGYNSITTLPSNFANLSSLRYLNIRANNIAQFPTCVCQMPNLEILDLSRNKLRALPDEPGRLISLRVLSMNSNRLSRLPAWTGKMKHLRILKLDHNPLEWPPPHISKMPIVTLPRPPGSSGSSGSGAAAERDKAKRFEDRQMLVWIAKLRSWINDPNNATADVQDAALPATAAQAIGLPSEAVPSQELLSLRVEAPPQTVQSVADQAETPALQLQSAQQQQQQQHHHRYPSNNNSEDDRGSTPVAKTKSQQSHKTASDRGHDSTEDLEKLPATIQRHESSAVLLPPLVPVPPSSDGSEPSLVPESGDSSSGDSSSNAINSGILPDHGFAAAASLHSRDDTRDSSNSKQHARNNSHSVVQDTATTPQQLEVRRSLKSKKSLPDLRKSHEDILLERRGVTSDNVPPPGSAAAPQASASETNQRSTQHPTSTPSQSLARRPLLSARRPSRPTMGGLPMQATRSAASALPTSVLNPPPAPGGLRKLSLPTVGATQAAAEAAAAALASRSNYSHTPPRSDSAALSSHGRIPSDRIDNNWSSRSASPTTGAVRNPADQERNSYFRRLSTLPPSTISKAVPAPVLKFVDGTRGVLFALSQIHAAIGQFMTPVMDERISGQFHRVLDISNGSITSLINSLDRFDSLSRRGTPEPSVIRGVLTTCKESVITFRKLVSVLQLQLRALQNSADVRYARTLLLMLCGSMAEVSNSWTDMAPLVDAVQPYLTQQEAEDVAEASNGATSHPSARSGSIVIKNIGANPSSSTPTLPSIAEASTPSRAGVRNFNSSREPSRRRHAGSFSAQDLAQGAAMAPSMSNHAQPFNLEDLQASSVYGTPARPPRSRPAQGSGGTSASGSSFSRTDSNGAAASIADLTGQTAAAGPSTPGASASAPSSRGWYATPGSGGTPSRTKRSGSNASSAADATNGQGSGAPTPRSQMGTPVARTAAQRHGYSLSNGAAITTATAAAGARLTSAVSTPEVKVAVDEHLLSMVDQITRLSAQVWSMLFEHLRSMDVDSDSALASSSSSCEEESKTVTDNVHQQVDGNGDELRSKSDVKATGSGPSTKGKIVKGSNAEQLRELLEFAHNTDELTSQLRSTYMRAREEEGKQQRDDGTEGANGDQESGSTHSKVDVTNPGEDPTQTGSAASTTASTNPSSNKHVTKAVAGVASEAPASSSISGSTLTRQRTIRMDRISQATILKLFSESHAFVRAIVETSTLIKTISETEAQDFFPRDLRRSLGQVAQLCSNLTVYLLWLSPN